jgi:hypothetical protein
MITPSFGLTATERVLPRLALDFTTASLDPRVTFTRTGNTATVTNSSGYIEPINANLPRFDFNPITLVCRGLLIEEARTNICLQSADFAITWTLLSATVSTNQINSPSNTLTADKIIVDNGAAMGSGITQTITTAAATYTFSAFAKIGEFNRVGLLVRDNASAGNNASVIFSLVDGSITTAAATAGTFTGASATSTLVANGFYRVTLTFTSTGASALRTRVTVYDSVATTGDGTKGIFAWGAQLEAGAFATSYIPTEASAVTRNNDVATMTGTNFSSWYNASQGAITVWFDTNATGQGGVFSINNGSSAQRIDYRSGAASGYVFINGGLAMFLGSPTKGILRKACVAIKNADFAGQVTGGTFRTATDAIPTGLSTLNIGSLDGPTHFVNGHIAKILYYPQRLINAEVQSQVII